MTTVVGFDVGRRFGVAAINYDSGLLVTAETHLVEGDEIAERCGWVATFVADIVRRFTPIDVGVEAAILHSVNRFGSSDLLKLHGALLVGLWRHEMAPAAVAPSALKKYATGDGRADKTAMGVAAAKRWPDLGPVGPDAIDALWVADWTRTQSLTHWGAE